MTMGAVGGTKGFGVNEPAQRKTLAWRIELTSGSAAAGIDSFRDIADSFPLNSVSYPGRWGTVMDS
jgi:hypothetical protein